MKLKLTPEFFILQDAASQSEIIASQDEENKEEEKIEIKSDLDDNSNLKYLNRTKRFIDTPEFHLLNKQKNRPEINNQENDEQIHLEPNIRIIERNGKIIYDKRFVKKRKTPKREIIQSDIRCVQLSKEKFGSSFGLTIRGGLDYDKPLIISSIQRNSPADKCRSLFLGDLIVALNGQSTYPIRLTHEQSMKLIKTGGNKLHLTVKHLTMYNRPIARFWQRQLNMLWLNNKEENDLNEDWTTHSNQNKQSINNSSMNSSLNSTALKIDKSSNQLINCTETQNRLSNLTVTITTTDKEDDNSQTPSPDDGVYTGLSNDALSSSECTESDASCFSSDYIQSSLNSNQQTNLFNSNQNKTYHHCNPLSSSLLSSKNEFNFLNNNESSLSDNKIDCLSIDCKNRKNNNSCMKCIINKNHENSNYNNNNNLLQRHSMNYRNSINQNTCFQSIVGQELNNLDNKENCSNFSNSYFRSSLTDYNKATSSDLQRTIKNSCPNTDLILGKCDDEHLPSVDCLQNTTENYNLSDQYNMETSDFFKQQNNDNIINSNEFCSCKNSSSNRTSSSTSNRNSNNLVDIVSVNLINCYFTKYIHNTDNIRRNGMEVRWFDLHNKHTKNKTTKSAELNNAIINFNDNELSEQFQDKINQYLSKLNESYMFSFNRGLKAEQRILFMGWISLALPKTTDSNLNFFKNRQQSQKLTNSIDYNWQPKYMIIKGGELRLYDHVPDYVLEKIQYTNDTLMEFNELSDLLLNKNGTLACSIILNNLNQSSNNLNKQKMNTQLNRKSVNRSKSLTRHLSIRGQDSSINLERFNKFNNDQNRILTETNNNSNKKTGNRLVCTLTRNLSLKTAKENRYNSKNFNSKLERTDLHCTLPRNKSNQFNNNQLNIATSQQSTLDRKQNLKRTTAASNLFTPNEYLLNQKQDNLIDNQEEQCELKWQNKPIIFKAYQSVLRQLKQEEQLDRRENCLLALTTQSDNTINNSLTTIKKQSINLDNSWYDNCENENQSTKNEIKKLNTTTNKSNSSMVAYLAVEHSDNISQILKSWNVSTMHSVIQISQKSFIVTSEGNYCKLTLDWHKGFTLYDNNSSTNIRWSFKFSQLKNSSDNGENTLWLSFQSIEHQPITRQMQTKSTINNHQSDNNSSLNSSMDSVDQYSQRSSTQLNRAITPCSFDSSINSTTMNSSTLRSNKLSNINSFNNDYYLQTNRNEFKIKKSIETKELTCNNLQHLIYCIHSFLAAKVTSVSSSMPTITTLN